MAADLYIHATALPLGAATRRLRKFRNMLDCLTFERRSASEEWEWGTLLVKGVQVQRLQEISRGDCMVEGCPFRNMRDGPNPRDWFVGLWNNLYGPAAWDANPWVSVTTFERVAS